jgi:hypothetical protein
MLKILNTVLKADLSLPSSVKGLELTDIGKEIFKRKKQAAPTLLARDGYTDPSPTAASTDSEDKSKQMSLARSLSFLKVTLAPPPSSAPLLIFDESSIDEWAPFGLKK